MRTQNIYGTKGKNIAMAPLERLRAKAQQMKPFETIADKVTVDHKGRICDMQGERRKVAERTIVQDMQDVMRMAHAMTDKIEHASSIIRRGDFSTGGYMAVAAGGL